MIRSSEYCSLKQAYEFSMVVVTAAQSKSMLII